MHNEILKAKTLLRSAIYILQSGIGLRKKGLTFKNMIIWRKQLIRKRFVSLELQTTYFKEIKYLLKKFTQRNGKEVE